MFVLHPLLRPDTVEARDYQVRLAQAASEKPSLIVLPTGLGKTIIALLALVHHLERVPDRRVLVLAPTKPLVEQHAAAFRRLLADVNVAAFTGETEPADRDRQWREARVIVATPQIVQNDLVRGARDLTDLSYIVYDEAHRGSGNYAYVFIARRYRAVGGTAALGLTASPGSDLARIQSVMANLGLTRIEVRTETDADVAPYLHEVDTQWVRVKPTPNLVRAIALLNRSYVRCVAQLRRLGFLPHARHAPNRAELIDLGRRIRAATSGPGAGRGAFEAASVQARALKIQHGLELVETQGLSALHHFLCRVQQEAEQVSGSRASRDFVRDPEFGEALSLCRDAGEPHPKVARTLEIVAQEIARGARRVLVFAHYRETADLIAKQLSGLTDVRAARFVGHARAGNEPGLTKKGQQAIVEQFRSGALNVLVATSVAEEGLDLPETDAVVLFEPVPSGIRMIQRRGRTGRRDRGHVFVLITEGTRDEHYYWASLRREKRMHEELAFLRKAATRQLELPTPTAAREPSVAPSGRAPQIIVDQRESNGPVPRLLVERGVLVKAATLTTGDYAVSDRVLVERKSVADFAASLRDGRLFQQAEQLAQSGIGILIVEGDWAKASAHLSGAAASGALAHLVAEAGVSVVHAPDAVATAELLRSLARREQSGGDLRLPTQRFQKRAATAREELRFLVEGLPGVGPVLADRLLTTFGSVAGLAAATVEDLERVEGVGPDRARTIREAVTRPYVAPLASPLAQAGAGGVLAFEAGQGAAR